MTGQLISVSAIRLDGGTQSRADLNAQTIAEYSDDLDALPPPVVFHDGADHWLADGFHRVHAHLQARRTEIECDVRQGTRRDAVLFSVGANSAHGLRRTNADKRRAVETLLRDEEWGAKSDRWIAETCGVSGPFVAGHRAQLQTVSSSPAAAREGRDGKVRALPRKPEPSPSGAQVEKTRVASAPSETAPAPRETPHEASRPAHAFDSRSGERRLCEALRSYFDDVMSEWPDGAPLTALLHEVEFMKQQVVSYMKAAK